MLMIDEYRKKLGLARKLSQSFKRNSFEIPSFLDQSEINHLLDLLEKKEKYFDSNFPEFGHNYNHEKTLHFTINRHPEAIEDLSKPLERSNFFDGQELRRVIIFYIDYEYNSPHIHVDTGMNSKTQKVVPRTLLGSALVVPLKIGPFQRLGFEAEDLYTLAFDQRWYGDRRRFHRCKIKGHEPLSMNNYSQLEGFTEGFHIEQTFLEKYCPHISEDDFWGLTLENKFLWKIGTAFVMDRTQLHCSTVIPALYPAGKYWAVYLTAPKGWN